MSVAVAVAVMVLPLGETILFLSLCFSFHIHWEMHHKCRGLNLLSLVMILLGYFFLAILALSILMMTCQGCRLHHSGVHSRKRAKIFSGKFQWLRLSHSFLAQASHIYPVSHRHQFLLNHLLKLWQA